MISDQLNERKKTRSAFTPEEDKIIKEFVQKNGPKTWKQLSHILAGRTPRQIRERYKNYLDPDVHFCEFTDEEDLKLLNLASVYQKKWCKLREHFPNRTDVHLKNRYNLLIRRKERVPSLRIDITFQKDENERIKPEILHETNGRSNESNLFKILNSSSQCQTASNDPVTFSRAFGLLRPNYFSCVKYRLNQK